MNDEEQFTKGMKGGKWEERAWVERSEGGEVIERHVGGVVDV